MFVLPPGHPRELRAHLRDFLRADVDARPVAGPMQRFVGAQHRIGDLSKTVRLETIDLFTVADPGVRPLTRNEARALRRVRSFDVPAVRGHITASHEDAFHDALVVFLRGRLGLELVHDDQRWALRKALLIEIGRASCRERV